MLISFAGYTRYARGGMLETLNQDYIRTARAKGLPERTVVVRHAFRNSLIPITTIVAADVGALIGGAIITERIFAFSGMGALFNSGLKQRRSEPGDGLLRRHRHRSRSRSTSSPTSPTRRSTRE